MKGIFRRFVLTLLAITVLALPTVLVAQAQHQPAVVLGQLLGPDPTAPEASRAYLVKVEAVRHGSVPFQYISVRVQEEGWRSHRLAEEALTHGDVVEFSLQPQGDRRYLALAIRSTGSGSNSTPFPPPLMADLDVLDDASDTSPQKISAATPGAPFVHQVVELVNEERLEHGNLPPLKRNELLETAAEAHSDAMAVRNFFAHCDLDTKKSPWTRMNDAGYSWNWAAENISAASTTPAAVMASLMASSGHRANILDSSLREIGVGYRYQSGDQGNVRRDMNSDCTADSFNNGPWSRYWTQKFGRRNFVFPVVIEREAWETSCSNVKLYLYGVGWAKDMRFSNDGTNWSPWAPYSPDVDWTLDEAASGTATVYARIRNGSLVVQESDTINITTGYPAGPTLDLSNQTVTGAEHWESCGTIVAGNFHVTATGSVTVTAREVSLQPGFSVAMNGAFRVTIR